MIQLETRRRHVAAAVCCGLVLLGMAAQILAFVAHPVPTARQIAATRVPSHYPADYTATDCARAEALDGALFWGDLAVTITTALTLAALLLSGTTERVPCTAGSKARVWLARILFLLAVYLTLSAIGFPFRFCRYLHYRDFGLTSLTVPGWLKVFALTLPVPLTIFVLKYLLVICTLPLCKRRWWIAAALGVFVIFDAAPEIVSRTYPADPVETLQPLVAGPHFDAMKAVLRKAGLDLPLMVVDESRRSNAANMCLTGRQGREYVLVTDTFVRQYSPAETALALAHELGHFQHKTKTLVTKLGGALLLSLVAFGLAFVCTGRQALPVSDAPRLIAIIMLCALVAGQAFGPVSLALSRGEEREADSYALRLTGDGKQFQRLLLKVARNHLTPLDLPGWRYFLSASHPTFLERIAAAEGK